MIVFTNATSDCPATIGTFQKAAEQMDFPAFGRSSGVTLLY